MSLLAPLYMLGLLAVSLPVIMHLIRRTPKHRHVFSSLMFVTPSPPRLTRRTRLDQWILLLLRIAALVLLACAFARPFLRQAADLLMDRPPGRQVAILVDTSASMRRGDVWRQAVQRVERVIAELEPADEVALYAFDTDVATIVAFEESPRIDQAPQQALIGQHLKQLQPTWLHTDLGLALVTVAEQLQVLRDRRSSDSRQQLIVISDLQQGADVAELQTMEWPSEVPVKVESITPSRSSNATLRLLSSDELEDEPTMRVRVSNADDSAVEQFSIRWSRGDGLLPTDRDVEIYVPPGQSRVVRLPRPTELPDADRLVLRGDSGEFDNTYFSVSPVKQQWRVTYLGGDEAEGPEGLHYYLTRALTNTAYRTVTVAARPPDDPLDDLGQSESELVVVSCAVNDAQAARLRTFLADGGVLLVVPANRDAAVAFAGFAEDVELRDSQATRQADYAMLGEIDFDHPVFAALAAPRYSDFTGIHFWQHYQFSLSENDNQRVLARFDNGDPALWEQRTGSGRLFVLASGWRPRDSQLALSTKFVPLLEGLLEQASGRIAALPAYTVGDPIDLPEAVPEDTEALVIKPDGTEVPLASGAARFESADQPGIYELRMGTEVFSFCANLNVRESDTTPIDVDRLTQYGVRFGTQISAREQEEKERQMRDIELEKRQNLWRWLIASALVVLLVETWWGGHRGRGSVGQEDSAEIAGAP